MFTTYFSLSKVYEISVKKIILLILIALVGISIFTCTVIHNYASYKCMREAITTIILISSANNCIPDVFPDVMNCAMVLLNR